MKKSLRIASAMAILLAGFSHSLLAQTEYFWNSGNQATPSWHTAGPSGNWRTGSVTGPFAAAPPTNADNVNFVAGSFSTNATVVVSQAAAVRNFTYTITANRQVTLRVNSMLEIAGATAITNGTGNNKLSIATTALASAISSGSVAVKFTSATATTLRPGGNNSTVFNAPVIFDGAGRWTLSNNNSMTIGHSATFTRGHLVALPSTSTGPNNPLPPYNANELSGTAVLIFTANATASGGSNASHVIGYVQKETIPSGSFKFIIGDGTYYRPLTSNEPTASTVTARYLSINPVSPLWNTPIAYKTPLPATGGVSTHEFWFYDAVGNSAPSITLDANHPNPEIAGYYRLDRAMGLTVASVSVSASGNAEWDSRAGAITVVDNPAPTPDAYNVISGGLSNARVWITIGRIGNTSLPVRLVSFTGQQLDGQVQLKWQSSEEKNTSHFEVERSADGKNFSQVLTKKAQGNSTSLVGYNALDNSPLGGTSYYRLKMVDLDGTFEYSKLVAVSAESTLQVQAYPNPSQGNAISLVAGNGRTLVLKSVSDLFGKQVSYQQRNAGESLQINFTQPLPAGFYVATLAGSDSGELVKVKFVVQ